MDFYKALAAEVLVKPYELVTSNERERAKKYWYARLYGLYDGNTSLLYINTFTFARTEDAVAFMATVSAEKLPITERAGFTLVYTFDNPYDAYISLYEAYSSGVSLISVDCKIEMPE